MKRLGLVAAGLALTACTTIKGEFPLPPAERPQVAVVNGSLVVSPEPLRFRVKPDGSGAVRIVWRLPRDEGFRFDKTNGIFIEGEVVKPLPKPDVPRNEGGQATIVIERRQDQIVECRAEDEGLAFSCLNKNSRKGTFSYSVRVRDAKGNLLPVLDPDVINEL